MFNYTQHHICSMLYWCWHEYVVSFFFIHYYYYYYYKCQDLGDANHKTFRGHITQINKLKTKTRVQVQLATGWKDSDRLTSAEWMTEKISLGLSPECCQRGGGPGLCWQTVPCQRCSHRKCVDGTSSVGLSTERRRRRATTSDVSRRLSARYAGAVPCTQWYARTHNAVGQRCWWCTVVDVMWTLNFALEILIFTLASRSLRCFIRRL